MNENAAEVIQNVQKSSLSATVTRLQWTTEHGGDQK